MTDPTGGAWSAKVTVSAAHTEAFERAFEGLAAVVSSYEAGDSDTEGEVPWAVEGMFDAAPPRALITARLALAARVLGIEEPVLSVKHVPAKDWLTENVASFPPLRAGRFYIHGDHITENHPPGAFRLQINAATAFGSGEHASTMGCLLALHGLFKRSRRHFHTALDGIDAGSARLNAGLERQNTGFARTPHALDMGTGTGILAMAMAKGNRLPTLAADIDPEAVRVARANTRTNGLSCLVRSVLSDGPGLRDVRAQASYKIITANILARPLRAMARDLARLLAPGGYIILAGFLRRHEAMVLTAYRMQGLKLVTRYRLKPWTTLVLKK